MAGSLGHNRDLNAASVALRLRSVVFGKKSPGLFLIPKTGRGKRIRTSGPCLPKTVLYQAELFPDRSFTPEMGARQERAYKRRFRGWQAGILPLT